MIINRPVIVRPNVNPEFGDGLFDSEEIDPEISSQMIEQFFNGFNLNFHDDDLDNEELIAQEISLTEAEVTYDQTYPGFDQNTECLICVEHVV